MKNFITYEDIKDFKNLINDQIDRFFETNKGVKTRITYADIKDLKSKRQRKFFEIPKDYDSSIVAFIKEYKSCYQYEVLDIVYRLEYMTREEMIKFLRKLCEGTKVTISEEAIIRFNHKYDDDFNADLSGCRRFAISVNTGGTTDQNKIKEELDFQIDKLLEIFEERNK